ncbi:MAG: ATP-grasp domain-containing protein [Myxococcales bacterium]|nr:ATP-grasp domain-containing protein [Myxococcales bacterium]
MKVLVANRGEIAVRVLRAAREQGFSTVAVYSEADRGAVHVGLADEAAFIGDAEPAASYLNVAALLGAAAATGATAIHPGYGFLSESAAFSRAVGEAGLLFIGASPAAIATMADKTAARAAMGAVGVPVVPGLDSDDPAALAALGFPLLIKAVAGGGGRGMRLVRAAAELPDALAAARAEALAAFADGRLYAERLVEQARHIEVQVLGDRDGKVVAVGARECSVQRRGQKLIEETPVPGLPSATLAAMEQAAVRASLAVGYVGAGTVEFLLAPDGNFWFLEMNTRIQVEHGVTELVTGLDLVVEQFRLAMGEPVPIVPPPRGHAIEARICAEDGGFLPCPGRLGRVVWPVGPGLRVDPGVESGSDVPAAYDSLLAKLMAWGPDRHTARARLGRALAEAQIEGLPTTAGLLAAALQTEAFAAGAVHTRWLEAFALNRQLDNRILATIAAAWAFQQDTPASTVATSSEPTTPWRTLGSWP